MRELREEIEDLRRALATAAEQTQAAARQLRARQREHEQTRSAAVSGLKTLRDQLERVAGSRAWRYGHGVTKSAARLRGRSAVTDGGVTAAIGQVERLLEMLGSPRRSPEQPGSRETDSDLANRRAQLAVAGRPTEADVGPGSRADELLLGSRVRDLLGPIPPGPEWPSVSVVIVSATEALTRSALEQIVATDYPALETIVVDNGSPDATVGSGARADRELEVQVRRLERAASFAHAGNLGAERAGGELLLFLNDDVRAIEPGWLRELVCSAGPGCRDLVGATLVNPRQTREPQPSGTRYAVEQRGIALRRGGAEFVPVRREQGEDVLGGSFGIDLPALAVSGACMLVPRELFRSIGGFDEGYQYGLEDIDLCLRARDRGAAAVCCGRAALMHEGAVSQRRAGREFRRINRELNHRRLRRLWGPRLYRDGLQGRLRGDPRFGDPPHLAIVRTSNDPAAGWGDFYTAMELGQAAEELGWRVTFIGHRDEPAVALDRDLDLAVVLIDRFDARTLPPLTVAFAWIRNWTDRWLDRPWLDRYDVLLASSERSRELLSEATGRPSELFPLATNARRFQNAGPGARPTLDWVFTGNRWGTERAIEPLLGDRRRERGAIFGRGWGEVGQLRALARGAVDYEQLPSVYADARVVLDDTAEPALRYDAVNARVFDALAAGVPVLTNCARGAAELFDDEFPTWSTREELDARLTELITRPERRAEVASRYRRIVLANHTYDHRARDVRRLARDAAASLSFCLKVGAPDAEQAERWGDMHLARALGRALRRLGHRWHIELLPDWDSSEGSTFDVTIHLRGRSDYAPAPGQLNVLWLISHPDELEPEIADAYDLVCVASRPFAEQLRDRVSVPVEVLEQATDPRVFFPDPDPGVAHELAFVGNSRGVRRKLLDDLLPTGHDLAIWGQGWDNTPAERYRIADHVAHDQLRHVYSSAQIVLCDHWPDMRAAGFRSNRLYDALACGALVVCDQVADLDGSLGESVVTYDTSAELRGLLERLLVDPEERARLAAGGRERVLAAETLDHRARELVALIAAVR